MGITMSSSDKNAPPAPPEAAATVVAAPESKASRTQRYAESNHNLVLLDPPRYGWTAAGGVIDLSEPHERARTRMAKVSFLRELKRKRDSSEPLAVFAQPVPKQSAPSSAGNEVVPDLSAAVTREPDESVDSQNTTKNGSAIPDTTAASETKPSGDIDPILFSARTQANTLDVYTYHRGRVGFELRDPKRGDLLCDVAATDTNHGRDAVTSLIASVMIQFPLQTIVANGDQCDSADAPISYFQESIEWDLMDVETPPPSVFAARIGEEFGLSLAETLELTESIEEQLYNFVSDHAGYSPALPIKDVFGQPREAPPPSLYALYGEVLGPHRGGMEIPRRPGKSRATRQTSSTKPGANGSGRASLVASDGSRPLPSKSQSTSKGTKKPIIVKTKDDAQTKHSGEIRKRLLGNSRRTIRERGINGPLQIINDSVCHMCQKQQEKVALFACGNEKHAFCDKCSRDLLDLSALSPDSSKLDFCPICSLICACDACEVRLGHLIYEFKQICKKRKSAVCETEFRGLFERAVELEINPKEAPPPLIPPSKAKFGMVRKVAKVPISKFPEDAGMGQNFDFVEKLGLKQMEATDGSYYLVDAENSNISLSNNIQHASDTNGEVMPSTSEVTDSRLETDSGKAKGDADPENSSSTIVQATIEDGSVDHCILCMQCGDLLCCDKCPRAYHARCINDLDLEGEPWECPACRREAAGILEEKLEGGSYLTPVISAFGGKIDTKSPQAMSELKILSIICEMLQYLMKYDFGYMFSAPVDTKDVPSYGVIVKEPMDFGTIYNNLLKGGYKMQKAQKSLENVIVAALNHISLVWHNCFLFNAPGSAIFRMAEVQKAAADRIRAKSLEDLLSPFVKDAVKEYWESCEIVHQQPLRLNISQPSVPSGRKAAGKPKERAKGIPILVLDPDYGRIVKIYSTTASAIAAIDMLLGIGYPCEWDFSEGPYHALVIRRIIKESASRTHYRLFGYRWLQLPDFQENQASSEGLSAEETASPSLMATAEHPMNGGDTDASTASRGGNG